MLTVTIDCAVVEHELQELAGLHHVSLEEMVLGTLADKLGFASRVDTALTRPAWQQVPDVMNCGERID